MEGGPSGATKGGPDPSGMDGWLPPPSFPCADRNTEKGCAAALVCCWSVTEAVRGEGFDWVDLTTFGIGGADTPIVCCRLVNGASTVELGTPEWPSLPVLEMSCVLVHATSEGMTVELAADVRVIPSLLYRANAGRGDAPLTYGPVSSGTSLGGGSLA